MGVSYKRIMAAFPDLTVQQAKELSTRMREARGGQAVDEVLEFANKLIGGFGVEVIRSHAVDEDRYYWDVVLLYVNTGDTYSDTVWYDTGRRAFGIGSYGDWVERYERRGGSVT